MNEVVNGNTAMSGKEKKAVINLHNAGLFWALHLPVVILYSIMILGMYIVWLICRKQMPFIDKHYKELLNFHISMAIYAAVVSATSIVLFFKYDGLSWLSEIQGFLTLRPEHAQSPLPVIIIYVVLMGILWVLAIKYSLTAISQSKRGVVYRYPLAIRFFK